MGKRKKKLEDDPDRQDKKSRNGAKRKNNYGAVILQDEGDPVYPRPARVVEEVTRPIKMMETVTRPSQMFENKSMDINIFEPVTRPIQVIHSVTRPSQVLQSVTRPRPVTKSYEMFDSVTRPQQLLQSVTWPSQLSPQVTPSKMFKCRDEVTDPYRSGLIRSSDQLRSNETCSIVFRGEQRDLLMLLITTLHLRYEMILIMYY